LLAGFEGEQKALKILSHLPNDYYLLNHLQLPNRTYATEIDLVVIGPNGVFIVEVKNYSGLLKGSIEDLQWKHIKTNRNGKRGSKRVKNPLIQVDQQISTIEATLTHAGIFANVLGTILFVNERCQLQIRNSATVPLFRDSKLLAFIKNAPADEKSDGPGVIAEVLWHSGNS
ncbi:MAG TPA: nuclease-related domain-containing protein, partial [Candidatus Hodarchaeales archaeon]|nr:nuclease-related domain-containing protein [Candidatus Hodarchaeales archaeon]